jgi:hypothetical protein
LAALHFIRGPPSGFCGTTPDLLQESQPVVLNPGVNYFVVSQSIDVYGLDSQSHSIIDIVPVSLGILLVPHTTEEELLDEMLEGRS